MSHNHEEETLPTETSAALATAPNSLLPEQQQPLPETPQQLPETPQQLPEPSLCLLWPRPQFLQQLGGEGVSVPAHLLLVVSSAPPGISAHQVLDLWQLYREELAACGHTATVKVSRYLGT